MTQFCTISFEICYCSWPPKLCTKLHPHYSAPAEGQQLQPKQTSDATSLLRLCCRASVCHSGKRNLDVAWHLEFPEMKAEVVVVALSRVPNYSQIFCKNCSLCMQTNFGGSELAIILWQNVARVLNPLLGEPAVCTGHLRTSLPRPQIARNHPNSTLPPKP